MESPSSQAAVAIGNSPRCATPDDPEEGFRGLHIESPSRTAVTFNDLPYEILLVIFTHYLDIGTGMEGFGTTAINFLSRDGETKTLSYVPWSQHLETVAPVRTMGSHTPASRAHRVSRWHKRQNAKELLRISLTSKIISEACMEVLFRHPEIGELEIPVSCFWDSSRSYLHRRTKTLSVESDIDLTNGRFSRTHYSRGYFDRLHKFISSGPDFRTLRSLELNSCSCNNDGAVQKAWFGLLPSLPALRKLVMRSCQTLEFQFSQSLPQVEEAHFYQCRWLDELNRETAVPPAQVLKRFPSLRTLVNCDSFVDLAADAFEPMKDTLETLVWVDTWTKPMKHQLAGAREAMMRLTSVKHLSLGPCQLHILARGDKGTFLNFHSTLETLEIVPMMKRDDEDLWGRRQRRPKPDQLHLYLLRLYEICALPSSKMRVIDLRSFMPQDVELIRILDSEIDMTIFLLARKFFRALGVLVLFQSLSRSLHYYFMEIFPSEIRPERKTELKAAFSEGDTGVSP